MPKDSTRKQVPLSIHKASGFWTKTHNGKRHYLFKVAEDPKGKKSWDRWQQILAEITHGRPSPFAKGIDLNELCEKWMRFHDDKLAAGEITARTHGEYRDSCNHILEVLGKTRSASTIGPEDFAKLRRAYSDRFGICGLSKRITHTKSLFAFAYSEDLIDRPAKYGKSFAKPSAKTCRAHRIAKGSMDFTSEEIRLMLEHATATQKAMILIALNSACGNTDIADMPRSAIDLDGGWLTYPRAKTAIVRRVPLWQETVAAIREAIAAQPKHSSEMLFVSKRGQDYRADSRTGWRVTGEFRQVLRRAKIDAKKRGFYGLRRTFQTQAEECGDLVACKAIMGHSFAESDMSARYRQRISDDRLRKVVEVVHGWLFSNPIAKEGAGS